MVGVSNQFTNPVNSGSSSGGGDAAGLQNRAATQRTKAQIETMRGALAKDRQELEKAKADASRKSAQQNGAEGKQNNAKGRALQLAAAAAANTIFGAPAAVGAYAAGEVLIRKGNKQTEQAKADQEQYAAYNGLAKQNEGKVLEAGGREQLLTEHAQQLEMEAQAAKMEESMSDGEEMLFDEEGNPVEPQNNEASGGIYNAEYNGLRDQNLNSADVVGLHMKDTKTVTGPLTETDKSNQLLNNMFSDEPKNKENTNSFGIA